MPSQTIPGAKGPVSADFLGKTPTSGAPNISPPQGFGGGSPTQQQGTISNVIDNLIGNPRQLEGMAQEANRQPPPTPTQIPGIQRLEGGGRPGTPSAQDGVQAGGDVAARGGDPSIPDRILQGAREAARMGPGAVGNFMAVNGHPRWGNWCGEFAAAVMQSQGIPVPAHPELASNWRNWGNPTTTPQPGDIAVRRGGVPTGQRGSHVTTVTRVYPDGSFDATGGNQGAGGRVSTIQHVPPGQWDFRTMRGAQPAQPAQAPAQPPLPTQPYRLPPRLDTPGRQGMAQPNQQMAFSSDPQRGPRIENDPGAYGGPPQWPGATPPPSINQYPGTNLEDPNDPGFDEAPPMDPRGVERPERIPPARPGDLERPKLEQQALAERYGLDWV
jgi:hypothetical protein